MKLKGNIKDVQLDYVSHKPLIIIRLNKQIDILNDEFNLLKDKEVLDIEIKEETKQRGLQANRYFHSLNNQLAKYNRGLGFAISDDEMKKNLNLQYGTLARDENGIVGAKVPKGTNIQNFYPYAKKYKEEDNCDCYIFYKRTSELNTKEFWQLLKGVEAECKKVGIETLEDREFRLMMQEYEENLK